MPDDLSVRRTILGSLIGVAFALALALFLLWARPDLRAQAVASGSAAPAISAGPHGTR